MSTSLPATDREQRATMTYAIHWGIKESFRDYLLGIEDAHEELAGGVRREENGEYVFPAADDASPGSLRCGGSVTIEAHNGLLDLRIREPWIEGDGDDRRLTVLHPGVRGDTELRVDLALLEPIGNPRDGVFAATLTVAGARAFDGVYAMGTRVDDMRVVGTPPGSDGP